MTWWWRMLWRNLSNTSNPSFTTTTGTLPTSLDVSNTFRFLSSWVESLSGELLNFFFLWLQLHLTDGFLNHKFAWWADLLIVICLKGTAGTLWSSTWTAMQTERATAWVTTTPCALPSQQRCHCTSKVSHKLSFIFRSPAWSLTLELPEVNSITMASAFSHRCLSPNTSTHFRLFCAEHHQREDLLGALVLVRLPRPRLLHFLLLPRLHHPRLWTTLQPALQDGRSSIMLSLKPSPRSVTNGTKTSGSAFTMCLQNAR